MLTAGGIGKGLENTEVIRSVPRRPRESKRCGPVVSRKSPADAVLVIRVIQYIGSHLPRIQARQICGNIPNGRIACPSVHHRFNVSQ